MSGYLIAFALNIHLEILRWMYAYAYALSTEPYGELQMLDDVIKNHWGN